MVFHRPEGDELEGAIAPEGSPLADEEIPLAAAQTPIVAAPSLAGGATTEPDVMTESAPTGVTGV